MSANIREPGPNVHWLTCYDEDDEPYGRPCECEIGDDHDVTGELIILATVNETAELNLAESNRLAAEINHDH